MNCTLVECDRGAVDRGWLFKFGACGPTQVYVLGGHLEDALEAAADWLADNAPGLLTQPSEFDPDDLDDDGQPVDHTCTEAGYIPSWEWAVTELGPSAINEMIERLDAAEQSES